MRVVRSIVPLVLVLLCAACAMFDPLERDAEEAGVTIEVARCEQDETTEIVHVTFRVTSADQDYDNILIDGQLVDATGTVVGSSATSVSNVDAGETQQGTMVLSPGGTYEEPLECELELNFAQPPVFE